jgi:hypothetical protein
MKGTRSHHPLSHPRRVGVNKYLGAMETDLLVRVALCLDPKSEAAKGIPEKALRSLGIDVGELAPEEREHREKRRLKLNAEFIPVAAGEQLPGAIPGLAQEPSTAGSAVPIPRAALAIIAEKIARGCEYKIKRKKFVEPPYAVRTRVSKPDIVESQFLSGGAVIDFGPGCQVIRIFDTEMRTSSSIGSWFGANSASMCISTTKSIFGQSSIQRESRSRECLPKTSRG